MENSIFTYNSKHDIYGNRRNLVVNHDLKEVYFYGCNAYNLGVVVDNLGIREVNKMYKEYINQGYKTVSHATVRDKWH
jgi:hypothetical protein